MMYPFMTINSDIEAVHSEMREDGTVKVYFEQPVPLGFRSIECILPAYMWGENNGFDDIMLENLNEFLHQYQDVILKRARGEINVEHEDGYFVATDKGSQVASQGKTLDEALSNLKEALELYYEDGPQK